MVCFWKKDELDNQGHETNTTFREVIWCIIPNKLAINHAFQDWWNSYQKRRQWNYETGKALSNLKTHFDWFSFQQKVLWNYFKFWKDRKPTTEISGVSVSLSNSNEGISLSLSKCFEAKTNKRNSQFNEHEKDFQQSFCLCLSSQSRLLHQISFFKSRHSMKMKGTFSVISGFTFEVKVTLALLVNFFESGNSIEMKRTSNCQFVFAFKAKEGIPHQMNLFKSYDSMKMKGTFSRHFDSM